MDFPPGIPDELTPTEALSFLRAFLDTEPDDDTLCSAALTIGEPLIDWHWRVIEEDFVALMQERPALRKLVSCCDFDESVPEPLRERLYDLVGPEDDIGRQPVERSDAAGPPRGLVTIAPALAQRVKAAPADEVARILRAACEFAVESSGLTLPEANAALTLLAAGQPGSAPGKLIERLWLEMERLDADPPGVHAGPNSPGAMDAFRRARACEALRYAVDPAVDDFADRAIFSAAFATDDRAEFLESLRSFSSHISMPTREQQASREPARR